MAVAFNGSNFDEVAKDCNGNLQEYNRRLQSGGADMNNSVTFEKANKAWGRASTPSSSNNRSNSSSSSSSSGTTGGRFSGVGLTALALKDASISNSSISEIPTGEKVRVDEYLKALTQGKPVMDLIKTIGSDILEQASREEQLRTDINENIGIAGQLSGNLRDDILDAYPATVRFGYGIESVTKLVRNLMEGSGRFNMISKSTIERAGSTARAFVGDLSEMGIVFTEFEKVGIGARDAMDSIDKAGKGSLELGLRAKTTVKDIRDNIGRLNEFGFKNGIQGLAEMSRKATEFRMKMDEVFKVADAVMDPDKAIELSANLQVLGGAMGDFNDPLRLMYDATNNVEGLQDALIGAAGSLATYNTEQGKFEITGINLRRAREMAKTLGVDYNELTKSAIASQERLSAGADLMGRGLNMKDEDKEFLTNLSRMEGGKMIIDVPESLQKKLGTDSKLALQDMSDATIKALLANKEEFEKMNPEEIAKDQFSSIKNIEMDLHGIAAKILRDTTKVVKGQGANSLDAQTKKFYDETIKPLADGTIKSDNNKVKELADKIKGAMESSGMTGYAGELINKMKEMMGTSSTNNNTQTNTTTTNTQPTQVNVTHTLVSSPPILDEFGKHVVRNPSVWDDVFNKNVNDYTTHP